MKPTDAELLEFSKEHVAYEINTLFGLLLLTIELKPKNDDIFSQMLKNGLIEMVIMHSRCLYEFLYEPGKYDDDAVATDFFEEESNWPRLRPIVTSNLTSLKTRSGKEVAHLTYKRQPPHATTKTWDLLAAPTDLLKALNVFTTNASKKKLHPDVSLAITHWNSLIKSGDENCAGTVVSITSFSIGATTLVSPT